MSSPLFPNAFHVARREYLVRVRGRAFLITTVLLAVAVMIATLLPTLLQAAGVGDEPPTIALDVQAANLPSDPVAAIESGLAGGASNQEDNRPSVRRIDDVTAATEAVRNGELDGLLTISRSPDGELAFEYLTMAGPGDSTRLFVTQAATSLALADRLARAGIAPSQTAELFAPANVTVTQADPDARDDENYGAALLVAYVVVILTFMAVITYGNWVAQSVAEEKLEPWMLPVFLVFFALGFILYSTLYAAAGSTVSRIEDVQQAVGALIFLSMIGYFVSFAALNDAGSGWVTALSLVPFFSPYLVPVRMLLTTVTPAEVVTAFALLALTVMLAIWVAARIYSAGVLLYGQRVGFRTVLRATRVAR